MKTTLPRISLIIALLLTFSFATANASIQAPEVADSVILSADTTSIIEIAPDEVEITESDDQEQDLEQDVPMSKEERKAAKQKAQKERLSKKPTFEEFLAKWQPYNPCGDENVDAFCIAASDLVLRYKRISDSINFIRIEVLEIPDSGDGITQAVKITDANGHPRTKESIAAKWTDIGVQIAVIAVDLPVLVLSGTNMVSSFVSDPTRLLNFGIVGQMKRSVQALNMLTIEIKRSVPVIQEQTALLKSAKEN